ncbi:uncharacterized protein VTP21DRAFT_7653 [Calcarisporiella thermophila]|uniref:uncharacterized protein n=1 Tax=Calcarisporiella thermophila TaxID=911321 RepID=UPI00374342D9
MTVSLINNFINGKYVAPLNEKYLDSFDPSTGKPYIKVADSTKEDVNAAVEAAERAFPAWSKLPRDKRSEILLRIADLLESRIEEFASAESKDQGKPLQLAAHADVPRAVLMFRYFGTLILHLQEKVNVTDGIALSYTQRTPTGVAGLISPWNLPLYLLVWKIAPCLASGCTCVCKPSEFTSVTANMLCSVMKDAGLPDGVCNMVFGTGPQAGAALVEHPKVPLVSFTGGSVAGEKISELAGRHLKKLTLELGGKNANIIFEDADLDACVPKSIHAAFLNQGEICLCGSRVFVQESIYDKFLSRFVNEARALKVGDPRDKDSFMGPVVSKQHFEKIMSYIDIARNDGGKIECGGQAPSHLKGSEFENGYFIEPTVITGLKPESRVMQEEIFGPVVTVYPFKTEEEAIALANGCKYGLSASVWSRDGQRARRVAEKLQVGNVWINTWMIRDMSMPFGGVKASGRGREGGEHAINFFTDYKTIILAD